MLSRDLRDILAGLFVAAVGLFFAIAGSGYAMGSAARMGPGYMPVILGWVLFALGVLIVLPAWFRQGDRIVVHWDSLAASLGALGRCCINRFQAKLPQTPAVAMPRLPSEDGPVL